MSTNNRQREQPVKQPHKTYHNQTKTHHNKTYTHEPKGISKKDIDRNNSKLLGQYLPKVYVNRATFVPAFKLGFNNLLKTCDEDHSARASELQHEYFCVMSYTFARESNGTVNWIQMRDDIYAYIGFNPSMVYDIDAEYVTAPSKAPTNTANFTAFVKSNPGIVEECVKFLHVMCTNWLHELLYLFGDTLLLQSNATARYPLLHNVFWSHRTCKQPVYNFPGLERTMDDCCITTEFLYFIGITPDITNDKRENAHDSLAKAINSKYFVGFDNTEVQALQAIIANNAIKDHTQLMIKGAQDEHGILNPIEFCEYYYEVYFEYKTNVLAVNVDGLQRRRCNLSNLPISYII